jgi:probable F420-dependent oxidoreductase
MRVGFALPVSGAWATPDAVLTVARRAEALGYAGLWTFQRLLVPVSGEQAAQPPVYTSVLDPTVVLGYAAAVTERVELGVAIINAPFVSPALLAKQLTTLDLLSRGRLVAGLGLGWLPEEFVAGGVPYERRGARMEEYIACLRALWGPDPVRFDGEFYQVPPSVVRPKPARRLPLLLGGAAPAALERIGRLGDGWVSSSRMAPTELGLRVEQIRAAARDAGRDPGSLRFVARAVVLDGPRTRPLTGPLHQVRDDLAGLAEQGLTDVFVDLNFDPAIGNPAADPAAALDRADAVLEALAPPG